MNGELQTIEFIIHHSSFIIMSDWIGLIFFVLLIVGVIVGLKVLAKPVTRTEEEFERNAAEGTLLGAGMNALQEILDPAEARAKEVKMQMKDSRYNKKKREGKANDDDDNGE
ncbi:MAG: hypothetical protein ABJA66_04670 [Actinomycetota bacterium]